MSKLHKNLVKKEVKKFFKNLIDRTNTYFLSDYVSDYNEFDSDVISKKEHKKIVEKRDILKKECERHGLNMHQISCDVANKFLIKNQ